jgi:hypothetical protein
MVERTFVEVDLHRSGPSSKWTFIEVHFGRNLAFNKNVDYNKLVETRALLRPFSPPPAKLGEGRKA